MEKKYISLEANMISYREWKSKMAGHNKTKQGRQLVDQTEMEREKQTWVTKDL